MSILIRGMEMPTEGGIIIVYKISGKFFAARAGKNELCPLVHPAEEEDEDDTPICTKASLASRGIYKKAEEGET